MWTFNQIFVKIVHIVEPFASGIATFIRSLVEGLRDDTHIIVHGERSQVMGCEEVILEFPTDNVHFIRWHSAQREIRPVKDFRAFLELLGILRRLKKHTDIDVVHLHSSKSGFLGRLACRIAGIRSVIYTPNGAPFLAGSRIARFIFRILEKIGASFGGRVVCCSPSEHHLYQAIGIDAMCINNGVPLRRSKKRVRDGSPGFRIVTCGRIIGQKNPELFNRIAAYFADLGDFQFIWIGDGPNKELLTAKNITITGWLPITATERLLSSGNVYISTSNFEGLPFAVLEALILRKPVLLKDCIGNRDIVLRGINGDLFHDADDAILKILRYQNNREMLPIMGEYSKHHCEQEFDVRQMSNAYRQLYGSLVI